MTSPTPSPDGYADARRGQAAEAARAFGRLSPMALIGPTVLIVAAAVLVVHDLGADPTVQVCDGEVMRPGDVCMDLGSGQAQTYDEMVEGTRARWWVSPAFGGGIVLVCLLMVVSALVTWRRDRTLLAGLDVSRPLRVAGAWPVRASVVAMIGMIVFLGGAAFSLQRLITDGWSWFAVIPIVAGLIGLFNVAAAWPRHGGLVRVHDDGSATIVADGTTHEVPWREVALARDKDGSNPRLQHGDTPLIDLEPFMSGRDSILAEYA